MRQVLSLIIAKYKTSKFTQLTVPALSVDDKLSDKQEAAVVDGDVFSPLCPSPLQTAPHVSHLLMFLDGTTVIEHISRQ